MRNNTLKFAIVLIGVFVILCVASTTYAAQQGYEQVLMEKKRAAHDEAIAEYLHLTQEQKEQLKQQRQTHHAQMEQLHLALKEKHEKLRIALEQENINEAEIVRIADELKQVQAQTVDARIEGILMMKKVLTPEQYKAFQEMVSERRKRIGGRGGPHRREHGEDADEEKRERPFEPWF